MIKWTSDFLMIDDRCVYWNEVLCIRSIICGRWLNLYLEDGEKYRLFRHKYNNWKATKLR